MFDSRDHEAGQTAFVYIITIGGAFLLGVVVGRSMGKGEASRAFDVLPNCGGLVLHDEERGLERAREVGRKALSIELAAMELFGGCGVNAVQAPSFAPAGRFVYLALRAVVSELVKREQNMTVPQAAALLEASLQKLAANNVDVSGLPGGLE